MNVTQKCQRSILETQRSTRQPLRVLYYREWLASFTCASSPMLLSRCALLQPLTESYPTFKLEWSGLEREVSSLKL